MVPSMTNSTERTWDDNIASTTGVRFEPETLMPSQMFDSRIGANLQPEKRLMLAVLEDAVAVYQRHLLSTRPHEQNEFEDTTAWIWSEDRTWPFSFLNVCDHLNLEGEHVRAGLTAWAERRRAGLVAPVNINPFRRVNGTRHKATGKAPGFKLRAA